MAVDRGGLNYSIKIRDEFSRSTIKFREELAKSKRALRDFRNEQALSVRTASGNSREESRAQAERLRTERERLRNLEVIGRLNAQQARAQQQAANQQQRADQAAARAQAQQARAQQRAVVQQQRMTRAVRGTDDAAKQLLFRFRRLVGTLAIFTLAREAVAGFQLIVSSAIGFNDQIQGATLGIAGLVSAIGKVRDAQGEVVEGAEAFTVATGIARKQVAALRQDSLRTVATFSELLDTFQVALGPGLAANLGLDEIRTLSVQISQAATALQVPQNQLSEEIRSLLSGTIQARTTRIATALGITNDDVRRLKETGSLFSELNKRLSEFSRAAEVAARSTVGGIGTLLKGALEEALGGAAGGLTEQLVSTLGKAFDNVVTIRDELGDLKPNPEFVEGFEQVFNALARAIQGFTNIDRESGFSALKGTLQAVAFTIDVISGLLQGVASVVGAIAGTFQGVSDTLDITNEDLGDLTQTTSRWAGAALTVAGLFKTLGPSAKRLVRSLAPATGLITVLGLAVALIDRIVESVTGVNTSIKETIQLVALGLSKTVLSVLSFSTKAVENLSQAFQRMLVEVVATGRAALLRTRAFGNELLFRDAAALKDRDAAFALELEAQRRAAAIEKGGREQIEAIEERARGLQAALDAEIAAILNASDPNTSDGKDNVFGGGDGSAVPDPPASPEFEERLRVLRQEQAFAEARARAAQATSRFAGGRGSAQALATAQQAVDLAKEELRLARAQRAEEIRILISQGNQLPIGSEARQQVIELVQALGQRGAAEDRILQAKLRQAELDSAELARTQKLERIEQRRALTQERLESKARGREARLQRSGSTGEGFSRGALEFGQQFASQFQSGIEIARTTLTSFGQFVSQTMVDAFDPTKDFNLQERIARFLQQIAQTIIQQAIQVAIAQRILARQTAAFLAPVGGAAGIASGGASAVSAIGKILPSLFFNQGGLVPHESRGAQGLAAGGRPRRPSHVPASDTVPAWLTPGEFVMSKSAVDSIGISTLSSLNSGNIGVTGSPSAASPSAGGMASGGVVSGSMSSDGSGGGMVLPAIVANERTLSQLNAGGRRSQLKFLQQNRKTVGGLLPGGQKKRR